MRENYTVLIRIPSYLRLDMDKVHVRLVPLEEGRAHDGLVLGLVLSPYK